jgi:hypothetical protein
MVGVAQLVEPRIVIPVVVGSSPIIHPIFSINYTSQFLFHHKSGLFIAPDGQNTSCILLFEQLLLSKFAPGEVV